VAFLDGRRQALMQRHPRPVRVVARIGGGRRKMLVQQDAREQP
jgi:hypothetical protein